MKKLVDKRYDFIMFFDVKDGNPNGDPDSGNLPRMDTETGHGLVTDVCLKRKVRNYVLLKYHDEPPYGIFIKERAVLNHIVEQAYVSQGIDLTKPPKHLSDGKARNKEGKGQGNEIDRVRQFMCEHFYDIRSFGAVLSIGPNAGQVRGPIQFTFARSIDPIVVSEQVVTRMAVTSESESIKQSGENRSMGRKFTIPYALYRAHGFISAPFALQTGFSSDDLALFWETIQMMFDHDHSSTRGWMGMRKVIIFEHKSKMGNAPVQQLFDLVSIERKDVHKPSRDFHDYQLTIHRDLLPEGVKLIELL